MLDIFSLNTKCHLADSTYTIAWILHAIDHVIYLAEQGDVVLKG